MMRDMWRLILIGCLFTVAARAETFPEWDPMTSWVFAVGVIQFDDPSLTSWPDEGRMDAQMIAAYAQRGVPADHIVFLKNKEATKAHIVQKFNETLGKIKPGDTLIFYYAGHGFRDYHNKARPVSFITYDTKSDWRIRSVVDTIEQKFHGLRVILTADCCFSGGLVEEVKRYPWPVPIAVLTSAQPSSTSTGNWTFTQCLTDMLNGKRLLDLNHDGKITLQETATYTNGEMAFGEGQLSSFATTGGFPADLVMAQAQGPVVPDGAGERCEGLYQGKWLKVTVLKKEGTRSFVTWVGWKHSYDSWLEANQIRPYVPKAFAPRTPVQIEWSGKWYPGQVLRSELGLILVHYDGYEDIDNEWVAPERLKVR